MSLGFSTLEPRPLSLSFLLPLPSYLPCPILSIPLVPFFFLPLPPPPPSIHPAMSDPTAMLESSQQGQLFRQPPFASCQDASGTRGTRGSASCATGRLRHRFRRRLLQESEEKAEAV